MNKAQLLFSVLRAVVCGEQAELPSLSAEDLAELYAISSKHDLAHMAGQLLGKQKGAEAFAKAAMGAVQRYVMLSHAYAVACTVLEQAQIPFLPLKGSVLRESYPEPWLRTSCDIDILVREETLEQAAAALENAAWKRGEKHSHDLSFHSPSGVHLELHFTVMEDGRLPATQSVLSRFWDDARPEKKGGFRLRSSDEMFYFYHMAHMAKHMEGGGCGVRSFLDVWVLNHRVSFDRGKRNALLAEGGLLKFAAAAENLAEAWFSGGEKDACSVALEQFVLEGGVYGNLHNRVAYRSSKKGGKGTYLLSRVFMKTSILKEQYPVLNKHPWLAPACQVHRWGRIALDGRLARGKAEMKANAGLRAEEIDSAQALVKYLGL